MTQLPETILQFGAGNFLRAFADSFIHQANLNGQQVGRVVVLQTTGDDRAKLLNQQHGHYHVVVRGYADGALVDRVEEVGSVSRALATSSQWHEAVEVARSPALRYVLSNTTEAGYTLDPSDRPDATPPKSFPAKLLVLLTARFEAGQPPLTLIPCELFENNADQLLALVLKVADGWGLPAKLQAWIREDCVWLNTLVDRIVPGKPKEHPLLASDPLLLMAEPFSFWALQEKPGAGPFIQHPAVRRAVDIQPYFLRKVRILNAAHTALLIKARPRGFTTVREAILDPELGPWLERFLFDEVVPTLEGRVDSGERFAKQTLDRFKNPYLEHQLSAIAAHHEEKVKIRLATTQREYAEKFGKRPPLLDEVVAARADGSR